MNGDKIGIVTIGEKIDELIDEMRKLSNRLEAALAEGDNPVSQKCSRVLSETPRCYDFSGSRRFSACLAWKKMEEEKISWAEAIKSAWDTLKRECTWE